MKPHLPKLKAIATLANHLDGDVDGTGERGVVAVVFGAVCIYQSYKTMQLILPISC